MAAIIAQLSLANRRRKKRQREAKYIESDKCVYTLPPFDRCYQPMKHNKYLKNKAEFERRLHVAEKAKGNDNYPPIVNETIEFIISRILFQPLFTLLSL